MGNEGTITTYVGYIAPYVSQFCIVMCGKEKGERECIHTVFYESVILFFPLRSLSPLMSTHAGDSTFLRKRTETLLLYEMPFTFSPKNQSIHHSFYRD